MITGKDSWKKGAALFALVLLAVLDIIFCTQNKIVELINALLVAGSLLGIAVKLYRKWSGEN